jgi:hypothetical protein
MDIGEERRVIIVEPEPLQAPVEEPAPQEPVSVPAPEPEREPVPAKR